MRTTIEIPDEQRTKLLEAAARRGEKGFFLPLDQNASETAARARLDLEAVGRRSAWPTT